MLSNYTESEEKQQARWTRQGLTPPQAQPTDHEILTGIVEKMEAAIGMYEQTAAAIEGLNVIGEAMKAGKLSPAETVYITNQLNGALELAGVKIDGTQPARQPYPLQFILRAWAAWAAFIVVLIAIAAWVMK